MQDFFQEFISFLLNSWKSLVFLFVFSYVLKETIGRALTNILRVITHLILDISDKTVSPLNSKDWEENYSAHEFIDRTLRKHNYEELRWSLTRKMEKKYLNLIDLYDAFLKSSFLFAILLNSELSSKLKKKTEKNLNYIASRNYNPYKKNRKFRKYDNQFRQIAFLFIHKFKFLLFKIYVNSKVIYVLNEKSLLSNYKKVIDEKIRRNKNEEFRFNLNLQNLPPLYSPYLRLLLDIAWYQECVQYFSRAMADWMDYDYLLEYGQLYDPEMWDDGKFSTAHDIEDLVSKINESDHLKRMKFDVFVESLIPEEEKDINYHVLNSPNYQNANWKRFLELRKKNMITDVKNSIPMGYEWICPDSQELQYEYRFFSGVKIEKVVQLIENLEIWEPVDIFISHGNLEESLKKHLTSKSIQNEKNYYYISRLEQLKLKIDNGFKYIDYTFIVIWFIITIFIEQNYFTLLESSISSLLEFLKYYFLINHLI